MYIHDGYAHVNIHILMNNPMDNQDDFDRNIHIEILERSLYMDVRILAASSSNFWSDSYEFTSPVTLVPVQSRA